MVLAVDIGNTNIVIGCFDKEHIIFEERLSTSRDSTSLEYAVIIKTVLELNDMSGDRFDGCIISSVVPSVTSTVREALFRVLGKEPMTVGPGIKTGLNILLDDPGQLGSDRVADAVAVLNFYDCPAIIIDMGTATTVSVINRKKEFCGGLIMPGVRLSLDSLSSRASQLPVISLEPGKRLIGTNTIDCMKRGIVYGSAAAIDGVIDRIEEEIGEKCTVISTGGLSSRIVPFCRHDIIIDDKLLLKGLMIIYHKNNN